MKARHICATLGIAAAVGAVVFMQSLVATNDRQAVAMAERMLSAVPVEAGAKSVQLQLDFRPDGRVLQGPPMIAFAAVRKGIDGALVTKALLAQRRVKNLPSVGDELTLVGRKGAYRVRIAGFVEWERPVRGYPNMFLPPSAVAEIDEDWQPFEPVTAEEVAPMFMSDAGRNMDRAKGLLLWAAALTALCLLVNSLFLSVESRRRELAVLRMVGLTRFGVAKLVAKESLLLSLGGLAVGTFAALAALRVYVACDAETFPSGTAVGIPGIAACIVATPLVALFGALLALKPALSVRPLEAASGRAPRKRHFGMLVAFAFGFGAFVAVEVWGSSLTKPFIPSPEWPDAIVSILPGGVSSFDIEHLRNLKGVKRIGELQPLQVNLLPLEELKGFGNRKPTDSKQGNGRKPVGAPLTPLATADAARFARGIRGDRGGDRGRVGDASLPGELICRILELDGCKTGAFFFGMSEENLDKILSRPWIVPGSDASLRAPWGPLGADHPHPRAYGTMPEFYRRVRALGVSREEAIARMTSVPARRFGIAHRGVIEKGAFADLAIWKEDEFASKATYVEPHQFSSGVKAVVVNGAVSYADGKFSADRTGRFLERKQ